MLHCVWICPHNVMSVGGQRRSTCRDEENELINLIKPQCHCLQNGDDGGCFLWLLGALDDMRHGKLFSEYLADSKCSVNVSSFN